MMMMMMMVKLRLILFLLLPCFFCWFYLLSFRCISATGDDCRPASCDPTEPLIRFPFRIIGQQPSSCGFPGFNLSCDQLNRTLIRLPSSSRPHIVTRINYVSQVIYIDPDFCRPNGIHDLDLTETPFELSTLRSYTFYNCSLQSFGFMYPVVPFACLSSANFSVIAVRTGLGGNMMPSSSCHVMKTIEAPVRWNGDIKSALELMWFTPACRSCEMEGRACGLNDDAQTRCLGSSRGLSTGAKYGLSLGIGVPASVLLICVIFFTTSRARSHSETRQGIDFFSIAIIAQPPSRTGLDRPTIESYPKTTLGESCRLPTNESTCAICLSDYKPKESLRMIPECNHYFHVDCIDEWLKLNATCPVCRNTPESSSLVTPCSIASTTSVHVNTS